MEADTGLKVAVRPEGRFLVEKVVVSSKPKKVL